MPKVSVIIPVYNTAKYLPQCLDSICGQTLKNIEIICINDCSPDDSMSILQQYAAQDERIRIVNFQVNSGVSAARNAGINAAQGKYIYFMDSDDWIDSDYLENMYRAIKNHSVDVVFNTGLCLEYDSGSTKIVKSSSLLRVSCGLVQAVHLLNWEENGFGSAWMYLFRTDVIKRVGMLFPDLCYGEDTYFIHLYLNNVSTTYVVSSSKYHYRQYPNSSCCKISDKICMRIRLYNVMFKMYEDNGWMNKNIEFVNLATTIDEPMTLDGYRALSEFITKRGDVIRKVYRAHNNPYEWIIDAFEEQLSYEAFSKKYLSHGSKNFLKNHLLEEMRKRIKQKR